MEVQTSKAICIVWVALDDLVSGPFICLKFPSLMYLNFNCILGRQGLVLSFANEGIIRQIENHFNKIITEVSE